MLPLDLDPDPFIWQMAQARGRKNGPSVLGEPPLLEICTLLKMKKTCVSSLTRYLHAERIRQLENRINDGSSSAPKGNQVDESAGQKANAPDAQHRCVPI